jgi:hypothetical protein
MRLLLLALGSMFFQQTYISLGKVLPAVLAPVVLMDLDIAPSWFGIYMALAAGSVVVVQVGCGSFIVRYGALRVSQVSLVLGGARTGTCAARAYSSTGFVGCGYRRGGIFDSRKFASPRALLAAKMGAACLLD